MAGFGFDMWRPEQIVPECGNRSTALAFSSRTFDSLASSATDYYCPTSFTDFSSSLPFTDWNMLDSSISSSSSSTGDQSTSAASSISSSPSIDFNVSMENSDGSRKFITAGKEKHLFIKKDINFALFFTSSSLLPPSGIIRVLLTSTLTPLVRCKADTAGHDQCLGNRFLLCSTEGAKHTECKGQHAIDISISELPQSACKPFALFQFKCQSSHLPKHNNKLTMEFYLFDKGSVMAIGYDSINVRVTPSIGREAKKLLATIKPVDCPPPSKRPKVESTKVPEGVLDFTRDNPPDKDGYYHFTWSGKDKLIFNLLSAIKKSSELDD